MKIALVQSALSENMEANLTKALISMDEAASKGAEAICFPEIQFSPFFPQYPGVDVSKYAIPIEHAFIKRISRKMPLAQPGRVPEYLPASGQKPL